jgi:two-component system, OmpR family, sensor histidine kinase RstB
MTRLYLTLYGVLIVTFGLFVAGLVWIPDIALRGTIQGYYERSMFGVYDLVEERLTDQPESEWNAVILALEPKFRHGIRLYREEELPDEARQRQDELTRGELVFVNDELQTRFYKRVQDTEHYLMLALGANREQNEIDDVEGIAHLLERRFMAHDPEQWPQLLQDMGQLFKMPLALLPLDDPELPADRLDEIRSGQVVILGLEEQRGIYFRRIADSDRVFRAGPFEVPLILRYFDGVLLLVLAMFIALAVYLWVRPVWRDLSRFDRGVKRFGAGDLDTRLEVARGSTVKPLADTFNAMAERMQRLIHSHRELTGAVSHELRTPIARLRFRVDMLEEPLADEDLLRHVQGMRKDILELEELVSESLSYSRLDRERPELVLESVYLTDWLQALLIETEEDLSGVATHLSITRDERQIQAQLDTRLMGRAVKNILRNARRHAVKQVTLRVSCEAGEARILVEDDGRGVPEQECERIFEPFARLDAARDRESGGVGLGLAIVRQIARWHDGRAWVENSVTGGARFVIAWPACSQ